MQLSCLGDERIHTVEGFLQGTEMPLPAAGHPMPRKVYGQTGNFPVIQEFSIAVIPATVFTKSMDDAQNCF
ncbi:MAG: hypothetical protein Kow0027_20800 [Saprospiraceae bacterium]